MAAAGDLAHVLQDLSDPAKLAQAPQRRRRGRTRRSHLLRQRSRTQSVSPLESKALVALPSGVHPCGEEERQQSEAIREQGTQFPTRTALKYATGTNLAMRG